jgi:hypothetical protein
MPFVILVGTKCDKSREIDKEQLEDLAKKWYSDFETYLKIGEFPTLRQALCLEKEWKS